MTLRFLVSGVVQGVGFRYFVLRRATDLGLAGWARNLPDGRVEVVAKGESGDLAALEEALRRGPRHSRVTDVEKAQISDESELAVPFQIK